MPAHLLSLADGPSVLLDKPILLFGRHEECDVQLNSKKVSRRHCVLAQVDDYLVIRDLGSTNGVRINGQRVAEGKLRPGDEVQIGNFKYQVCGDLLGREDEHPRSEEYENVAPAGRDGTGPAENAAAGDEMMDDDKGTGEDEALA
ncbi:MAG: FHA domain-containing protein [Gemmata sp.]|jgi:pSer/pThr/pTyr-binding forkhead associated (FHA) protein